MTNQVTMDGKRRTTEMEQEVLVYLNELRESGVTNMYGAGPYIQEEFGVNRTEARKYLTLWMANFGPDSDYEYVNDDSDGE
jgi:hypothetical protein